MSAINASIREFGDSQTIVAYVEVDNPAYQRVRHLKKMTLEVPYFDTKNKGKQIGCDFYFECKTGRRQCKSITRLLERMLGVKVEKFRGTS